MATIFKNAPLVELAAELRWAPQFTRAEDESGKQLQLPQSLLDQTDVESFYQRFGGAVYQHGFKRMERLIPHGVPQPHDRVVCRYRHDNQQNNPVLVQVGPAVFSTNALTPYKSWAEFRPWIERAVSALLEANPETGPLKASVRYIDVFDERFLAGRTASEFFKSDLGISLALPEPLTRRKREGEAIGSSITAKIPLDGMQMTIKASEATFQGQPCGLMDTLVAVSEDFDAGVESALTALDAAHDMIHDTFFELTQPIKELLDPEGGENA